MAVTVRLTDDIDVSRGSMLCRPNNRPTVGQDLDATVCWMTDRPLRERQRLLVKHTTRTAKCVVRDVMYRLDVNTLHPRRVGRGAGAERHRPGGAAG